MNKIQPLAIWQAPMLSGPFCSLCAHRVAVCSLPHSVIQGPQPCSLESKIQIGQWSRVINANIAKQFQEKFTCALSRGKSHMLAVFWALCM